MKATFLTMGVAQVRPSHRDARGMVMTTEAATPDAATQRIRYRQAPKPEHGMKQGCDTMSRDETRLVSILRTMLHRAFQDAFRTGRTVHGAAAATAAALVAIGLTAPLPALAQTETQAAQIAQHDTAAATAWDALALGIRKAVFVTDVPAGFAQYQPRENATFVAGEPLLIYLEPVGYGFMPGPEGVRVSMTAGFDLETTESESPRQLVRRENAFQFEREARAPFREFFAILQLATDAIPEGDFALLLRVEDAVSGDRTEVRLPFSIILPPETAPQPEPRPTDGATDATQPQ